jgi:hypothetical protein
MELRGSGLFKNSEEDAKCAQIYFGSCPAGQATGQMGPSPTLEVSWQTNDLRLIMALCREYLSSAGATYKI